MTILIDRTISNLSDIVGSSSKRGLPPLFSNTIIGVKPTTQPMGIYYALRYIYSGNNNQTPTSSTIALPLVRRAFPKLFAQNLVSVVPTGTAHTNKMPPDRQKWYNPKYFKNK